MVQQDVGSPVPLERIAVHHPRMRALEGPYPLVMELAETFRHRP